MLGISAPSIQITLAGINASIIVERQFLKLGEEAFKMMMVTDGANCHLVFAWNKGGKANLFSKTCETEAALRIY